MLPSCSEAFFFFIPFFFYFLLPFQLIKCLELRVFLRKTLSLWKFNHATFSSQACQVIENERPYMYASHSLFLLLFCIIFSPTFKMNNFKLLWIYNNKQQTTNKGKIKERGWKTVNHDSDL
jgi:hypothetical protein